MMQQVDERVKVVARVRLGRGAFEVAFLESGEAILSCGHVAECPRCYSAWELGEAEGFAPDQAQHLALALRPLLSAQEFRAIMETLREC